MSHIYRSVITVRHELVHEANTPGEADMMARGHISSLPGVREEQISGVISRPLSVVEQLQRQNLTSWQESEAVRGEPSLYERWAHNLLPEAELLTIVRQALFAPMNRFNKRRRMSPTSIPHPRHALSLLPKCGSIEQLDDLVRWSTTELPDLSQPEYRHLTAIADRARLIADHPWLSMSPADCVTTHLREHVGTCSVCKRTATQRSVLVTVQWAGRTLSREYAL